MENQNTPPDRYDTRQEKIARMHGGASKNKYEFAKEQRRNPTPAEKIMWEELRGKRLGGYKFREQHPFGRFVLDFYCLHSKLSVEIDGTPHNTPENIEYDKVRTDILKANGITELRFSNEEVFRKKEEVLAKILAKLNEINADKKTKK